MKAITFTEFGGPEVLQLSEIPKPVAGPGQVLVQNAAIGLNFADIYRRRGTYTLVPPSPYVLGYEGAGTVVEVGATVSEFKVGDRVAWFAEGKIKTSITKVFPFEKAADAHRFLESRKAQGT